MHRSERKQGIRTKGNRNKNERKRGIGAKEKQSIGIKRRRKKQKGVIATSGERKGGLNLQQAFQIRQRGIRTYRRADKEELMAS